MFRKSSVLKMDQIRQSIWVKPNLVLHQFIGLGQGEPKLAEPKLVSHLSNPNRTIPVTSQSTQFPNPHVMKI